MVAVAGEAASDLAAAGSAGVDPAALAGLAATVGADLAAAVAGWAAAAASAAAAMAGWAVSVEVVAGVGGTGLCTRCQEKSGLLWGCRHRAKGESPARGTWAGRHIEGMLSDRRR